MILTGLHLFDSRSRIDPLAVLSDQTTNFSSLKITNKWNSYIVIHPRSRLGYICILLIQLNCFQFAQLRILCFYDR